MKDGEHCGPMSPLKRLVILALAWGASCGLIISLVLLSVYFYTQRPKVWDTRAVRVKAAKAEALSRMDERLEETGSGTDFTVDLENTTGTDITLPSTLTIMQARKGTGSLHDSLLKLDRQYFLPAHHVVSITLANDNLCVAKLDPQNCFDAYFGEDSEIVIFDEMLKYEIHISIPAFTRPKNGVIRFRPDP